MSRRTFQAGPVAGALGAEISGVDLSEHLDEAIIAEIREALFKHPGSVVFYDNRATQHNPGNDFHGYRRILQRVTLAGAQPV